MKLNIMDGIVLLILALYAINGLKKGFMRSIFGIVSQLVTLLLVHLLNPIFATYLRRTSLYSIIYDGVLKRFGLDGELTTSLFEDPFTQLALPDFIKNSLFEHNNPEVYQVLQVDSLAGYIAGYITNVCINVISGLLLFIVIGLVMKMLFKTSRFVNRIPVVRQMNAVGGLALGILQGVLVIWILFVLMTLLIAQSTSGWLYEELYQSYIAIKLFHSNILLYFILKVFY